MVGIACMCGVWIDGGRAGRRAGRTHEDRRGAAHPRGPRESSSHLLSSLLLPQQRIKEFGA